LEHRKRDSPGRQGADLLRGSYGSSFVGIWQDHAEGVGVKEFVSSLYWLTIFIWAFAWWTWWRIEPRTVKTVLWRLFQTAGKVVHHGWLCSWISAARHWKYLLRYASIEPGSWKEEDLSHKRHDIGAFNTNETNDHWHRSGSKIL